MTRILVVDDDEFCRALLRKTLNRLPETKVVEAENGAQAIARAHEGKLDLILLDIMMPVMDGLPATTSRSRLTRAACVRESRDCSTSTPATRRCAARQRSAPHARSTPRSTPRGVRAAPRLPSSPRQISV